MKQVVQNLRGDVRLLDLPVPALREGGVLVRTLASVISPGTERTNVERSRRSLVARARERPDLLRAVLKRMRKEGLRVVMQSVGDRLDEWIPMGYSSAGIVEGIGEGVTGLQVGDLVACAGGGYAVHAEMIWVPSRLVAKVPAGVAPELAAFATLGAIALQGIRQAEPRLGELVVVVGLGILGQLTVQMLRANGCLVIAADFSEQRRALALAAGARHVTQPGAELEGTVAAFSEGRGADAVIITASSNSAEPIKQAGRVSRDRGRVVVVGAVPVDVPRSPFYEKEIELRFSRSYGPGRYDPQYEERGHDYPIGYVRWTEQRNLQAFLELAAQGAVDVSALVSHRFEIEDAERAYRILTDDTPSLGMVLTYAAGPPPTPAVVTRRAAPSAGALGVALVGPGSFAKNVLLPAIRAVPGISLRGVVASSGISAHNAASASGFAYASTDVAEVLADRTVHAVFIATRHDSHAGQVIAALEAGKHVFVEKPLCLNEEELQQILRTLASLDRGEGAPHLMVGFNRRFAPHVELLRRIFAGRESPLQLHYRVNAGRVPPTHWVHDPRIGGGRILGEGCHFVDTLAAVVGSPPRRVYAEAMASDSLSGLLSFPDGSIASLEYTSVGHPDVPKEWLEVTGGGIVAQLQDFTALEWWTPSGRREERLRLQDKGHRREVAAFLAAVREGGTPPISRADLIGTTRATFRLLESAAVGVPMPVDPNAS